MARRKRGRRVGRRIRREPAVVVPPIVIDLHSRRRIEARAVVLREHVRRRVVAVQRFKPPTRREVPSPVVSLRSGVVLAREPREREHLRCRKAKSVRRHLFFKSGGGSPRPERREHPC